MNLQQLKTFVLIGELGSLSKVSDRIRIAQPALSRQMRLLQEEVGVPLLARHRLGLRLTEAGEEMLRRVSGVIRQLDQAFEDVRTLSGAASRPGGASVSCRRRATCSRASWRIRWPQDFRIFPCAS